MRSAQTARTAANAFVGFCVDVQSQPQTILVANFKVPADSRSVFVVPACASSQIEPVARLAVVVTELLDSTRLHLAGRSSRRSLLAGSRSASIASR